MPKIPANSCGKDCQEARWIASLTCQNLFLMSQAVWPWINHSSMSPVGSNGYWLLPSALLSGFGSEQILRLPEDFLTTFQLLIHSVLISMSIIIPLVCSLVSSSFCGLIRANGLCISVVSPAANRNTFLLWCCPQGFQSLKQSLSLNSSQTSRWLLCSFLWIRKL